MTIDLNRLRKDAATWIGGSWESLSADAQAAINNIVNRELATYEKCVLREVRAFAGYGLRHDVLDALYRGPFYELTEQMLPGYFLTIARALDRCGFEKEAKRFETAARTYAKVSSPPYQIGVSPPPAKPPS